MFVKMEKVAAAKRIADASEKFAVGSLLVAAFQGGNIVAVFTGFGFLALSLLLTMRGVK
jgi:hypothetical protein